jgi:LPS-assembly lipoprotein
MWSSSQSTPKRIISALATVGVVAAISACSFTPLYGGASGQKLALSYAEPTTRTEQIIYQHLALRLGKSGAAGVPLVKVTGTTSTRTIGRTSTGLPITTAEVTVTANAKVTQIDDSADDGIRILFEGTKLASAPYTTNGQRLTDQQAFNDATARAAKAVGESLSLQIRAKLTQNN